MLIRIALLTVAAACLLPPAAVAADASADKTRKLIAVLQSDAVLFDKARACQQLGEIGTGEAVPALAALLADPQLSAYARSGLEGIPDPEAAKALRAALATLHGNLLAGVINSLGVLRDPDAVGALRKLAGDPGSGVARESVLALGRIPTAESLQFVQQALTDGPEALRPDAAAACLLAAEKQMTDGHADKAQALYDAVRAAKVPATLRAAATRGAILARKSAGVALLIEQLRSEDRLFRNAALITIREIPSDALAAALNAELDKAGPELQVQLLLALLDCHNPQSLDVLQAKAASEDAPVRKTALTVLGRLGGPAQAGTLLQAITQGRSPEESALALNSLGSMQGAAIDELIVKALASATDADARARLIRVLEGREATGAVGELLKQAADANAKVSIAACGALKRLAGATELPALIGLTKSRQDESARQAAESAVIGVCTRTSATGPGGELALAELKQATDAAGKSSWIRILAALGCAPALPAIKTAAQDPDEAVAANAIEQLGRWPDPTPMEDLFALVESGTAPGRRHRALVAAIHLATAAADEHQRPDSVVAGWLGRASRAAQTLEEKRLIVSGLGRLKHMDSLRLLLPYLDDPGLQTEAALAVVQIAPALAKVDDSSVVKETLETIAATAKDATLRTRAATVAKAIPARSRPVVLFDGRSLAGWEGDPAVWRVRDGVIVGGSMNGNPRNEFLATVKEYMNFVLRLEYKLVGTEGFINSGVQFRSARVKQPSNEMSGFQADIGAGYSGCLYDESRRNKFLVRTPEAQIKRLEKPGEWNRYEVRCAGPRLQIVLNGEKTVDYTEIDPAMALGGLIGLQIHGGCKAEVSFRNLTIEDVSYGVATREFGVPKTKWKILSFSSENTQNEDERAVLAIDDNPDTFWHTLWSGGKPGHPHHLAVDLAEEIEATGFTYLPRQDGRQVAGVIGDYEFYVSRDGKDWGQAVAKGRFEKIDLDPTGRVVILGQPVRARYLKLVSLNAPGGQPFAGAAEVGVMGRAVRP